MFDILFPFRSVFGVFPGVGNGPPFPLLLTTKVDVDDAVAEFG